MIGFELGSKLIFVKMWGNVFKASSNTEILVSANNLNVVNERQ